MKLTKEELASLLTGREIGDEISEVECEHAKESGLIVIFGASDDLMEFRGVCEDELGCYNGDTALIDAKGLLPERDNIEDDGELEEYFKRKKTAKTIESLWCKEGEYSWTFKTSVPHATFEIVEDDEPYCRGIVISITDL